MKMPFLPQLETMVKEFLQSERPMMYRRMLAAGELDAVATMRAQAAREAYETQMAEIPEAEVGEMNRQLKTDPLASVRYMTQRQSQIVEDALAQMLDFPSEEAEEATT